MIALLRSACILLTVIFVSSIASAQVRVGTPPYGSYGGGPDVINLANLNSHVTIPVLHKAGRGGFNFTYDLSYDSSVWYPVTAGSSKSWQPVANFGWAAQTQAVTGYLSYAASYSSTQQYCGPDQGYLMIATWTYSGFVYNDTFGVPHPYTETSSTTTYTGCGQNYSNSTGFTEVTADGSGYTLDMNGGCITCTLTSASGKFLVGASSSSGSGTDRNGNKITVDSTGHFY